jgi:hypothetical protein
VRSQEYLIGNNGATVHRAVVLELATVTNSRAGIDERALADYTILPDDGAGSNSRELPDLCPGPNLGTFFDVGKGMDEGIERLSWSRERLMQSGRDGLLLLEGHISEQRQQNRVPGCVLRHGEG